MGDIVADMRLFADLRKAAADLKPLDTPNKAKRAAASRDGKVYQAVSLIRHTVAKITGVPLDDEVFWNPQREAFSTAEKRFEKLRKELAG